MRNPHLFEVGAKAYLSQQSLDRMLAHARQTSDASRPAGQLIERASRYLGHIGKVMSVDVTGFVIVVEFYAGTDGITQSFRMNEHWVDPIRDLPAPHTERSSDVRGRVVYDPSFDFSKPWSVVLDGSVHIHMQTREEAQERLHEKGCRW